MSSRMIELSLASFAGGSLASWAASQYIMPMLLGDGSQICIVGGSGADSGLKAVPSTFSTMIKLLVDGVAFFVGMMLGQYIAGQFL